MARYDNFYHLVKADCACEQATDMEFSELLKHCTAVKRNGTNGEGSQHSAYRRCITRTEWKHIGTWNNKAFCQHAQ